MRFFSALFVALLLAGTSARAQTPGDTSHYVVLPINLSFVQGLSIGDVVAQQTGAKIINTVSINILTGRAAGLRGVEASGIWGTYDEDVRGAQFAGLGTTVGGSVQGAQFAGLLNVAGDDVRGGQFAGLVNIAGERAGAQFAGLVNIAGGGADAQVGGLMGIADGSTRAQFSGLVGITGEDVHGVQSSGFVSIAGDRVRGVQVSGFANVAGERVRGAQLAGLVNVAPRVEGVQIGVVNVAETYARGVPIGLVSYVDDVGLRYDVWGDETGTASLAVRSGTQRFSNYFGLAARPTGTFRWGVVAGLGGEWAVAPRAYAALDVLSYGLRGDAWEEWAQWSKVRLLGGYWFSSRLALVAGPTFNVFVSDDADGRDFAPWSVYDAEAGGSFFRLWPGLHVGLRLSPRGRAQR